MCEPELGFQDSVSVCAGVCFGRGVGACVCVCARVRWLPTSQWKVQHPSLALWRCAERPGRAGGCYLVAKIDAWCLCSQQSVAVHVESGFNVL